MAEDSTKNVSNELLGQLSDSIHEVGTGISGCVDQGKKALSFGGGSPGMFQKDTATKKSSVEAMEEAQGTVGGFFNQVRDELGEGLGVGLGMGSSDSSETSPFENS